MNARRLILLRHGQTAWNAQRRFQGSADPPLDTLGRQQAERVAPVLALLAPDSLVSSTATRAEQTAQAISARTGLEVRTDARLRERALGDWEGLTVDEVAARFPDEYAVWSAGRDVVRAGGESREQVAERVLAAVADLPDAQTTLLVMHGASATALMNALLGIDQDRRPLVSLSNCHWSELVVADAGADDAESGVHGASRWRLRAHNLAADPTG